MTRDAADHERPGCTIGMAVGLGLVMASIAGLIFAAVGLGGGALDGEAYMPTAFREGRAPYGLVPIEAVRLPSGEALYSYGLPDAGAEEGDHEQVLEPRRIPDELILIEYRSAETARTTFLTGASTTREGRRSGESPHEASANLARWEDDPSFAWHTTIEAGSLAWSRWLADYRIERAFREGGTWRDSCRVDLGQEQRNLLLFAFWPAGVEATVDGLREVLSFVRMQ